MPRVELPYRFPKQADVIYEEALKFRQLSSTERFLRIVDLMASGKKLMAASPKREFAARQRAAQEEEWRRFHQELFARHGH